MFHNNYFQTWWEKKIKKQSFDCSETNGFYFAENMGIWGLKIMTVV